MRKLFDFELDSETVFVFDSFDTSSVNGSPNAPVTAPQVNPGDTIETEATIPNGAESEVAFISGVTSAAKLAATTFWTWTGGNPAGYGSSTFAAKWGNTTLSTSGTAGGNVTYWFDAASNWSAAEQSALAAGLSIWSAEANITFSTAANAASANQIFYRGAAGSKTAFQNFTSVTYSSVGSGVDGDANSSKIVIDTSQPFWHVGTSFDDAGGYGWQTVVHEIGHMVGLGHGGPYNGQVDAATQQFSNYDSRLWSLMSYIDPTITTAKYYNSYPVIGTNWGSNSQGYGYEPTTPMILDILAVQRIYGAPTSGPLVSGGQVFGFNTNITGSVKQFFDFNINQHPVVTIWDGGLNNTLDVSGFSAKATINLNPGTFSSVNGQVNNIAIASDTTIETAITGPGNDTITGSTANNTMRGNTGDDTIDGGGGTDSAVFSGARSSYVLTALAGNGVRVSGPDGTDTLANVERLVFSDQTVVWTPGGGGTDDYADSLSDAASPFGLVAVNGSAIGTLEVLGDRDWFRVQLAAGTNYTVDLQGADAAAGTLADPRLYVRNSAGTLMADNDDIVNGVNHDSRLSFTTTTAGIYYLEAGAFDEDYTGTYRISLRLTTPTDDFRDSLGDATAPFGQVAINGSSTGNLEVTGDRDWFSIQVVAGASYLLNVQGQQAGGGTLEDPYLRVHNSSGALVAENDDIVLGVNRDSRLTFTANTTGVYYLEAGAFDDDYTGTYKVSASVTTPTDDFRDNLADTTAPLGVVAVNGSSTGTLELAGDRDWFSVGLIAGTTYRVDLQGLRAGGGTLEDPYVRIRSSSGALVSENDDIDLGVNRDSLLTFQATTTGTYYLEAGAFEDNYTGTYRASISSVGSPGAGSVAINDVSITEGNNGTKSATFTVTRSGGTAAFSVNFATSDGSGTVADHDYFANSGTLNFGAGVNTQTISVTINGDLKVEPDETFAVNLSGATNGVTISDNLGIGTIVNDEGSVLTGATGNDTLAGGPGNDTIDGGRGIDTATFSGLRSAYSLTHSGNSLIVSGPDGTDTLTHIEKLAFSDQTVTDGRTPISADFNGDGFGDILWQHNNGAPATWLMHGTFGIGSAVMGNPGAEWQIKDAADFNGDGKADILWQNDNGTPAIWLMNGPNGIGSAVMGNPGADWHIKAAADFNGDGKADILWQNDNGTPAIWLMDGTNGIRSAVMGNPGADWQIKAAADFNGDHKADILWQNDNGTPAIWLMDGTNGIVSAVLGNPGADWRIKDAADFSADGKADILWQNDNGTPAIWLMDGTNGIGTAVMGNPGTDWLHI
jgi:hypothetical protein